MKNTLLLLCLFFLTGWPTLMMAQIQSGQHSNIMMGMNTGLHKAELKPQVSYRISPNESEEDEEMEAIKEQLMEKKRQALANGTLNDPHLPLSETDDGAPSKTNVLYVNRSFEGNINGNACPADNSMAISTNGYIVSAINRNIYAFDEDGTYLGSNTIYDFFTTGGGSPLSPSTSVCDPKVIYDKDENKFILFSQVCNSSPTDSRVLLAFSVSEDPTAGWYIYSFYGNIQNYGYTGDAVWFDYPKMAYTSSDVVLTGNMFDANSTFETVGMFLFDKAAGFSGQSNVTSYAGWGLNGFTYVPLQNISSPVGNSIWLTAKESGSGSLLKFYQYTGPLPGNLTNMPYSEYTTDAYSSPPDGIQPDFTSISMGDGRMMDGYIKNGTAHFVFPEDYNNYSAIRYYRVQMPSVTGSYTRIYKNTAPALEYSWPSVTDFGTSSSDQSSVVGFQCASNQTYPELRVKYYDNAFVAEASIQVIAGENSLSSCANSPHRWGDYTTIARKPGGFNNNVWIFGSYAQSGGEMGNYLAEIGNTGVFTEEPSTVQNLTQIFPNPANAQVTFQFNSGYIAEAHYVVVNMAGVEVLSGKLGTIRSGEKDITLETSGLEAGMYHLRIVGAQYVFTSCFGVVH